MAEKNKNELVIRKNTRGHWYICYEGAGRTPESISGVWTTKEAAQTALVVFKELKISSKKKKEAE